MLMRDGDMMFVVMAEQKDLAEENAKRRTRALYKAVVETALLKDGGPTVCSDATVLIRNGGWYYLHSFRVRRVYDSAA